MWSSCELHWLEMNHDHILDHQCGGIFRDRSRSLRTALQAQSAICGPADMPRSPGCRRRGCVHSCAIRPAPDTRRRADRFAAEMRQRTAPTRLPEADEPVPSECADRARRPARSAERCRTVDRPLKRVEQVERHSYTTFGTAYMLFDSSV